MIYLHIKTIFNFRALKCKRKFEKSLLLAAFRMISKEEHHSSTSSRAYLHICLPIRAPSYMASFAVRATNESPIKKKFGKVSLRALARSLFGEAPTAKTTVSHSMGHSFP
jgi:hypothetical protein